MNWGCARSRRPGYLVRAGWGGSHTNQHHVMFAQEFEISQKVGSHCNVRRFPGIPSVMPNPVLTKAHGIFTGCDSNFRVLT